jgi:peptidoglycan/LPS O-acetylase OafA/YrhL
MQYRREIDGLRAVAVIPVVLFHAGFEIFSGGYVGVDVFFVISGYLITSIIISELEQGDFSIVRFYERRARRILPALFFVILCCIPFAWIWMVPSELNDFGRSVVAVSLFASNILFWRETDYFEPAAEEQPLLHTWSLAVEEQYYMLFPLFLVLVWRFGHTRVFYLVAAIGAASLLLSEWGWRNSPTANFYLAPTRVWELLAGSLCAFVQFGGEQKRNDILAALGLGLIVLAILAFDDATPFPSIYALVPVGGTALIILFGANGTWTARLLSSRPLVGIGLISYSVYLWHQPLFAFARIDSPHEPSQLAMLCLAALSFALAYLSWQYVEKPFRRKQRRLLPSRSAIFGASTVALLLFLTAGIAAHATDGFRALKSTDMQRLLMKTVESSPKREACHMEGRDYTNPDDSCEYFADQVRFAIFGDSHAVELAYAFADLLEEHGIGIKQFSFSACAPSYGDQDVQSDCSTWTHAAMGSIIRRENIETVIVSYRINTYLFGGHEKIYPGMPMEVSEAQRKTVWDSYIKILQEFLAAGKKVVLVLQAPELPDRMEALIYGPAAKDSVQGPPRDWWIERTAFLRQHLREIPAGVTIVDPADLFCDATVCYAGQHSISYYFDDDHMSVAGAGIVADAILSRLKIQEPLQVGSDPRHGDAMMFAHSGRPGLEAVAGDPGHR